MTVTIPKRIPFLPWIKASSEKTGAKQAVFINLPFSISLFQRAFGE
jgi:hypothetical protein